MGNRRKYKKNPISYEINHSWREAGTDFYLGLLEFIEYVKDELDVVVELGSYLGDSTIMFAEKSGIVYSVDPYIQDYDPKDGSSYYYDMFDVECNFIKRTSRFSNIVKMKMKSEDACLLFSDNSIGVGYIDSIHQEKYVAGEIERLLPKIREGGFISGHDYGSPYFPGVKEAVDSFFQVDRVFRDLSWVKRV